MKLFKVFTLLMVMSPAFAQAASYQGKVTSVFAYKSKVYIRVTRGGWDAADTCTSGASAFELWLDPATDYGKALLSIVMVAKTTDRLVWTLGDGNCSSGPQGLAEQLVGVDLKG